MAAQDRRSSSYLRSELLEKGHTFSFFQAIRLLRLLNRTSAISTRPGSDEAKSIRIRPELSLGFPAADIANIKELPGETPLFLITATFLGLYGTSSPLPTFYTEDLLDEAEADESVIGDFLNIINHRLFWLFFRCWTKYRQMLQVVEEDNTQHLQRLFCLLGLGEKELREEIAQPHWLIRYVGLFTQFPRSGLGLRTLLQDVLGELVVEVIPCVQRTVKIPPDQRLFLGTFPRPLGQETFIGEEIEDRMGKFRLQIGPLNREQYQTLFPGTPLHQKLTFLTKLYVSESFEYDLELILSEGEARPACLGGAEWSRLGLDSWIFSSDTLGEVRTTFHPESI